MLSYCVIALIFQAILKGVSIMFKKLFFALILGISVTVSVVPSVEASSMNVNAEMETRIAKMRNIGSVQIINCADEADVVLVADRVQRLLILVHQVCDDHHLRFIAPSETNAEGLHILLS